MFLSCLQALRHSVVTLRNARLYATATALKPGVSTTFDSFRSVEAKNERLLRVIEKRVAERTRLQSELSEDMSSPEDVTRLKQLKESELLAEAWDRWKVGRKQLEETMFLLEDPDPAMRSLAAEEIASLSSDLAHHVEMALPALLVPPSETTHLGALMELKSGVGGSEASLFLAELLRMYQRLAMTSRWKVNVVAKNDLESGGIKDATVEFKGNGAYDSLRWESGVHRVQRVPATETSGRTHTSTVAIVVLPLMEETDVKDDLFNMEDVKVEVMRARGAGGQHVNKTESAVRLTHTPTGITVSMQDERSQHQNKRRAFQVLSSRLMDLKLTREMEERRSSRRNLVKGADRSEKIRTYNFAQDRVTDHRIGMSRNNLTTVMEGDGIELFIEALKQNNVESEMEAMLEESE